MCSALEIVIEKPLVQEVRSKINFLATLPAMVKIIAWHRVRFPAKNTKTVERFPNKEGENPSLAEFQSSSLETKSLQKS